MLALIDRYTEAGYEDNRQEPEEESEPVDRIPVRDRQKHDRLARHELGREDADNQRGHNAERQKNFLPDIHAVNLLLDSTENFDVTMKLLE